MTVLQDRLRERRGQARAAADEILTRAGQESRDLSPDELAAYTAQQVELREVDDELDRIRDEELATLRARVASPGGPVLSRESADIARAFQSAIYAKNPAPIEFGTEMVDEWPEDMPEVVHGRVGKVRVHTRDTLKTTRHPGDREWTSYSTHRRAHGGDVVDDGGRRHRGHHLDR